jgi:ABC-type sugar transport system substrate-binding protein
MRSFIAVLVAGALVATGCSSANKSAGKEKSSTTSSSNSGGAKDVKVAFVYPTTTTNFAQEMALGAKAAAQDTPGVNLTESAPAAVDGPKEVQLFQAATRASKDGVAMMTLTPDLFLRPLQTAASQNVPLVAVDVPPPKGAESAVKLLIGNSNVEIGEDLAKALLPKIPKGKKGQILIGTDTPGLPVLEQRNQGFESVIKQERPGVTFLVFDAKQSPTDNFNTWSSQVKAHPNALAYVGPGSQAAVSLSRIQRKPGQKKLLVGADDLDPVALQGVKDGFVEALVSPEHWLKGYIAVKLMAQAAQGGKPLAEGWWNPGALIVNAKNIDEIMARQQDPASRQSYFKAEVAKQLASPDQYLKPMPTEG